MLGFYIRLSVAIVLFLFFYIGLHRLFNRLRFKGAGYIFFFMVILSPLVLNFIYYYVPLYYQETYAGRVIDNKTGQPVPGTAVLAIYREMIDLFFKGDEDICLVRETETDPNGEFSLPGYWKISFARRGSPWANIVLFKPGYTVSVKSWHIVLSQTDSDKKERSGRAGKYVYLLTPLMTDEARMVNIYRMDSFDEIPFEKKKHYMKLLNEERASYGLAALR